MKKLFLSVLLSSFLLSCNQQAVQNNPLPKSGADTLPPKPPEPREFADARYTGIGKERMRLFEAGEFDKWGEGLAENTITYWSAGDSLIGKKAIVDYWKEQQEKNIEWFQITNDSWLPLKVNIPQSLPDLPGVWVMCWNQANVKYKNKKTLQFLMHQAFHFNAQDKIDRTIMYLDQAPINKVLESDKAK